MFLAPADVKATPAELELNHFYCAQFSPRCYDEFAGDIWKRYIPLAARTHVGVWHAANATAAIYRFRAAQQPRPGVNLVHHDIQPNMGSGVTVANESSLRQLSASLTSISTMARQPALSISEQTLILMANLLYIQYCFLRGDYSNAADILARSIRLMEDWQHWKHELASAMAPPRLLLLCYIKTEVLMQAAHLLPDRTPWNWKNSLLCLQDSPLLSMLDACAQLDMLWSGIETAANNRSVLLECLGKWKERFDQLQLETRLSEADRVRGTILRMQEILIGVRLEADTSLGEMRWDEFEPQFRTVTSKLDILLQGEVSRLGKPTFTPMVMRLLHFMAMSCRNPTLRRWIVSILRAQQHKEQAGIAAAIGVAVTDAHHSYTRIVDIVMETEEIAWDKEEERLECSKPRNCVSDEFICSNHRVVEIRAQAESTTERVCKLSLRTAADVSFGRPERAYLVLTALWS